MSTVRDLIAALERYAADDACILTPDAPDWKPSREALDNHLDHCRYCTAMLAFEATP